RFRRVPLPGLPFDGERRRDRSRLLALARSRARRGCPHRGSEARARARDLQLPHATNFARELALKSRGQAAFGVPTGCAGPHPCPAPRMAEASAPSAAATAAAWRCPTAPAPRLDWDAHRVRVEPPFRSLNKLSTHHLPHSLS